MAATPTSSAELPPDNTPKFRPRACARCSQSKLKCNWLSDPGVAPCERCARTKSECVLPSIKPRGPGRGKSTRVGQLEQKLDGIMSLLTASQHIQQSGSSQSPQPIPAVPVNGSIVPRDSILPPLEPARHASPYDHTQARLALPAFDKRPSAPPDTRAFPLPPLEHIEIVPGLRITYHEADQALYDYINTLMPHFPFVYLLPGLTAYDFNQEQPFLFRTVVQVTLPQTPQLQRQIQQWFREYIADKLVVQQEKNLEHLQALLVYLCWTEHVGLLSEPGSSANNLLGLALSLVVDLNLAGPPTFMRSKPSALVQDAHVGMNGRGGGKGPSLEEMRAVLGVYYLRSFSATHFRRTPHLPGASHLEQFCEALWDARQCQTDFLLVKLVRMQRLVAQAGHIYPDPDSNASHSTSYDVPTHMAISSIRQEIDRLQPPEPERSPLLDLTLAPYHGALLALYEPILTLAPPSSTPMSAPPHHQTAALYTLLQSSHAFFALFLALPLEILILPPAPLTALLSFAILTTTRLLLADDLPGWDAPLARKTLDFVSILRSLQERCNQAEGWSLSQADGAGAVGGMRRGKFGEGGRSMCVVLRDRVKWLRGWYLARLPAEEREAMEPGASEGGGPPGSAMQIDGEEGEDVPLWQALLTIQGSWG